MSVQSPYSNDPQATVLGETVWFDLPVGTKINHADLGDRLALAGLDRAWDRALAPSYAFVRAVRSMARAKLVDRVTWSQDLVTFQISVRVKVPDGVDYQRDALVSLDRTTGAITCPDPVVRQAAGAEFQQALAERRTTDVTRLIARVLGARINKTTFPMKGGVWFVLASDLALVDQLEAFVTSLGGTVARWAIANGGTRNVQQVQTVVVDSFTQALEGIEEHIQEIHSASSDRKVEGAYARLTEIRTDLEFNARRIGDHLTRLEDYLAYAAALLERRKNTPPPMAPAFKPEDGGIDAGPEEGEALPEGALVLAPSVTASAS